ncbi:male sterility protein-domain-containing protein [Polychytrium aggregatum]|uniref:male sterility protein-domain-containing protein n=1 Tax=Polychytrium aggregatum TaxID=110093 RepID=UPI0022FF15A7|nr:male sterility protein-domain-containing protein [Polychytrium aggregatum]KAI9208776.1 male sterility protein-domain-containing protein [Polychytrium aggregatum]
MAFIGTCLSSCCFLEEHPRDPLPGRPSSGLHQEIDLDPIPSLPQQPQSTLPMTTTGASEPWLHPLEAFVNLAAYEPTSLAIFTNESGSPETVTYLEAWERAYAIAQGLQALPDWSDDVSVVALHVEPEVHWVLFTYALWILGRKVINFALNWPASIRTIICHRLNIKFILYESSKPGPTPDVHMVSASSLPRLSTVPPPSLDLCAPLQEYVGYISTSGTTGIPRTFPAPHRMGNTLKPSWPGRYISNGVFQAPSFSVTMGWLLSSANVKGSLWFPRLTPNVVDKVKEAIALLNSGMQLLFQSPSFMNMTFRMAQSMDKSAKWPAVKSIVMGGEMLPPVLVHQARELCPNALIRSIYGSSETGAVGIAAYFVLSPAEPVPTRLVYTLRIPNVRIALVDNAGQRLGPETKRGILCFAIERNDPKGDHPDFHTTGPQDPLASFGYFADGTPRICTMDDAELVRESEFVIHGRSGRRVKVNGINVDLGALESLLLAEMRKEITHCNITQTADLKITMLYVLARSSSTKLTPSHILTKTEYIFALQNIPKIPIHNFLELTEIPLNGSGKTDLNRLQRLAEQASCHGLAMGFPPLELNSDTESKIAAKVSRLGSEIVGIDAYGGRNYYIAGIGFDSLTVVRLAIAIKEEFGVEISPMTLLSHGMTPQIVASIIQESLDDRPFNPPATDLTFEVVQLDDASISAERFRPYAATERPRAILLTGATGFLGSFLLFELAERFPDTSIVCLARAEDDRKALERVRANCHALVLESRTEGKTKYDIWDRVTAVRGDLGQPLWGLATDVWLELARSIDLIVHNGAEVHWLHSYERLKSPNVLGTLTALKLATTDHLKAVHFISTMGAIPLLSRGGGRYREEIYPSPNISGGYGQTKWVSEQLVSRARSRGVPATVVRPSIITGDSVYGVSNSDDYIWRFIRGCIEMKATPSQVSNVYMSMSPVDYVAAAIAEIVAFPAALDKFVFHISCPRSSISQKAMFEQASAMGWQLLFVTADQFEFLLRQANNPKLNILYPLMVFVGTMDFHSVDDSNTRSIVSATCPEVSESFGRCLQYLAHVGYLPPPANPAAAMHKSIEYPEVSVFSRTGRHQ